MSAERDAMHAELLLAGCFSTTFEGFTLEWRAAMWGLYRLRVFRPRGLTDTWVECSAMEADVVRERFHTDLARFLRADGQQSPLLPGRINPLYMDFMLPLALTVREWEKWEGRARQRA